MTGDTAGQLRDRLLRSDGQEDLCFALYRPSTGALRDTALVFDVIAPEDGDRLVHGNASFQPAFLLRALDAAEAAHAGLALLHSHPAGRGWQDMSADDIAAERGIAAQTASITDLPLLGMTIAGDGSWSARRWHRVARGHYARVDAESTRIIADRLAITYNPQLLPEPALDSRMARTISAWGPQAQCNLARQHIAVVGLGSVGMLVAEALVRTGVRRLTLVDFDSVKAHNLDRLAHASQLDAALRTAKVTVAERALRQLAPFDGLQIRTSEASIVEPDGISGVLDCDAIFSCVDRPWPRQILDQIAFAHLIPVIDGGVAVAGGQRLRRADWKAHISSPTRRCLHCIGQYTPAEVGLERAGDLDDPHYIQGLNADHPLRASENVYAFSAATASLEVLRWLSMTIAPLEVADVGEANYHFVTGTMDVTFGRDCEPYCPHPPLTARGDAAALASAEHPAARDERLARARYQAKADARVLRELHRRALILNAALTHRLANALSGRTQSSRHSPAGRPHAP